MRLHYATTLDECLDANERMFRRLPLFRKARSRHLWWTGGSFATALTLVAVVTANAPLGLWVFALAAFASVLAWGFCAIYGRWYYDACVRRQTRAALVQTFGATEEIDFQLEPRDDTLWSAQNGFELAFPWRTATEVRDAGDSLEIWFSGGLVLARNRGFISAEERKQFFDRVLDLIAAHRERRPSGTKN